MGRAALAARAAAARTTAPYVYVWRTHGTNIILPPQAARQAAGDDLHAVLEPGAGAQGGVGERAAAICAAATIQDASTPWLRLRSYCSCVGCSLMCCWLLLLAFCLQPPAAALPLWRRPVRPARSRQLLSSPAHTQARYSADRRTIFVTTKATAPGGVRTGEAGGTGAARGLAQQRSTARTVGGQGVCGGVSSSEGHAALAQPLSRSVLPTPPPRPVLYLRCREDSAPGLSIPSKLDQPLTPPPKQLFACREGGAAL